MLPAGGAAGQRCGGAAGWRGARRQEAGVRAGAHAARALCARPRRPSRASRRCLTLAPSAYCGALPPPPPVASSTTSQARTCRVGLDAMPMHLALLPLPHVLAVRAPRVRAEAVDPPKLHLRDDGARLAHRQVAQAGAHATRTERRCSRASVERAALLGRHAATCCGPHAPEPSEAQAAILGGPTEAAQRSTHLADVLVSYLPRVHAEPVHPAVLPLTLELVATRKGVRAAPALQPSLPVALIARPVGVQAHADAMQLAILHAALILALHGPARNSARAATPRRRRKGVAAGPLRIPC
eukprot:scaffold12030_cov66-Phaeocystis_antarctica.AAC.4